MTDKTQRSMDTGRGASFWMMRILEWDEPRARYPNLWRQGMPRRVLAYRTVASRLRLGDLVAVFYPASQKHPERSQRFVGLSRVAALMPGDDAGMAWIEFETAHRFAKPLDAGRAPRRVFLCCDPGWPEQDRELFRKVYEAAVAEGWRAEPGEAARLAGATPAAAPADAGAKDEEPQKADEAPEVRSTAASDGASLHAAPAPDEDAPGPSRPAQPRDEGPVYVGAVISPSHRDPKDGTWIAVLSERDGRLRLRRLESMHRAGLHQRFTDPDPDLMRARATGLGWPLSWPAAFVAHLLGADPDPQEAWWDRAGRLVSRPLPDYLTVLAEFRERHGEVLRITDERCGAPSPLHRRGPDLGAMAYHGVRMLLDERSRYTLRPFESAKGRVLMEVSPWAVLRRLTGPAADEAAAAAPGAPAGQGAVLDKLANSGLPLEPLSPAERRVLERHPPALLALLAARCAAAAVLRGELEHGPETLVPEAPERVRVEGWIYGAEPPAC